MRLRRLSYSIAITFLLALSLSACSLDIARSQPNWLVWSGGVVYYRCTENGVTTYKGEVQRVVVLGQPIRFEADTIKPVALKGRCETSGAR